MLLRNKLWFGLLLLLLSGCSIAQPNPPSLTVGFTTPPVYWMEVGHVQLEYEDGSSQFATGGVIGEGTNHLNDGRPWALAGGGAFGISKRGVPVRVTARWFSMAEQKHFEASLDMPEDALEAMSTPYVAECEVRKSKRFANKLIIGMAPGGVMRLWYRGSCIGYKPIGRAEGLEIESRDMYKVWSEEYFEEEAEFLKQPIPYGRW